MDTSRHSPRRSALAARRFGRIFGSAQLCCGLLAMGCAVGQGKGEVNGWVTALDCGLERAPYKLAPTFFGGDLSGNQLTIQVRRGSRFLIFADGLVVQLRDVDLVQASLGQPLAVRDDRDALVSMVLYLADTCQAGFAPGSFRDAPVAIQATEGFITFDAVYGARSDPAEAETSARFDNVRFADRERPAEREALLSGSFSFFFQRGAPAQRFP